MTTEYEYESKVKAIQAVGERNLVTLKSLIADGDIDSKTVSECLVLASLYDFIEIAEDLIKSGADVNFAGGEPLKFAVLQGNIDIIKRLIDLGADIHARDDEAMRDALTSGRLPVVDLLFKTDPEHFNILFEIDPELSESERAQSYLSDGLVSKYDRPSTMKPAKF